MIWIRVQQFFHGRKAFLALICFVLHQCVSVVPAASIPVEIPPISHLYWVERSQPFRGALLRRMPKTGGPVEDLFADDNMSVRDITIDPLARKLYWAVSVGGETKIQRRNLNGSNAEDIYVTSGRFIDTVKVDTTAQKIYWPEADRGGGSFLIRRANLDGTGIEDVVTTPGRPSELVLDLQQRKMYWVNDRPTDDNKTLHRANLDGSQIETLVEPIGGFNMDLDVRRSWLYHAFYGGDQIYVSYNNGGALILFLDRDDGLHGPLDLKVDSEGGFLYWANSLGNSIMRSPVLGFSGSPSTLVSNLNGPRAIALGPIPEPDALSLLVVAQFAIYLPRRRFL